MRRGFAALPLILLAGALSACAPPLKPTEITRFSLPDRVDELGQGSIAITAADPEQAGSSAYRAFAARLAQALTAQGYSVVDDPKAADQGARISYRVIDTENIADRARISRGGPPTIGGQSLGLGVTFPLDGRSANRIIYQLQLRIIDHKSDQALWEARGQSEAQPGSEAAQPAVFADKLVGALFSDFPGRSGETISVP